MTRLTPRAALRALAAAPALLALVALAGPASAQISERQSYVVMTSIAVTGERCGLLDRWEAATILAETRRLLSRYSAEERSEMMAEVAAAEPAECTDPTITTWIDGARPGIEREWLPPNLALFHAFAALEAPPLAFLAATEGVDVAGRVAAIDAALVDFASRGILPEGGGTWEAYLARVDEAAVAMAASLRGEPGGPFSADEAAAFIIEATLITGLWLSAAGE